MKVAEFLRFQKCKTLPAGPVANAYAKIQAMTNEERLAAHQKFLSDAQVAIDAAWAKGTCSKQEMYQAVAGLCPFQ